MINVDISNIWGGISLPDLLGMEKDVAAAHQTLMDGTGAGGANQGWLKLPTREPTEELTRIQAAAEKIRSQSDVFVVVGIGGSCLGARAAIELLQGPNYNMGKGRGNPQIYFAGNSLSTRQWNELCRLLEGKDFSVAIISKSGTTTEPAIATRALRWMLERRFGTDGAKERIFAITDPVKGALRQMAEEEGWQTFSIPPRVGGRYSVLTAVGLLPMAVAGIDIAAVLRGAAEAKENFNLRSFENPVWLYCAVRNLLYRKGKAIEILEGFEPAFAGFGKWWQHLFAECEGKEGKGIFPVPGEIVADMHTLGQMIQQGERNMFETMVRFEKDDKPVYIGSDINNLDGLNYLAGQTLDFVDEQAFLAVQSAHVDGSVPVITVECGPVTPETVGEFIYFMELSSGISAYILGVYPFNHPGVECYKRYMLQMLGKPGFENL